MRLRRFGAVAAIALATVGCGGLGTRPGLGLPDRSGNAQVEQAFARGEKQVAVDIFGASNKQITRLIEQGFDFWAGEPAHDGRKSRVRGVMSDRQWASVQEMGLDVVKLPNTNPMNHYDPKYTTYDQMTAELKALAAKAAGFAQLVELGKTHEGRPILALKFGIGDTSGKPAVLFSAENHARELATPEMGIRIARWLVDGYGKDAEVTYAIDNREIWVTPMVNPDGHIKAEKGNDWRKNTNPKNGGNPNSTGPTGAGVDLNRNYMSRAWGSTGTDKNPSGVTYGGPGPNSELETQAMSKLYAARKYAFLMTFHSFSNLVMWPWNDSDQPPDDPKMPAIGKKLGELSGYHPEQGSELYYTSGDDTDHMWSQHKTYAYCIEIGGWGDGFDPPYSRVEKFWGQVHPMVKYVIKIADNPGAVFGPEVGKAAAVRVDDKVVASRTGRQIQVRRALGTGGAWGPPEFSWAR
ncbi:MAG: zinc carboxypeptidase [Candidatus Sericytochromatia bacterium]|nr:zinc carboxypeptidase [Candidatus Tanganyikabacteria bacterium]